MLSFIFRLLLRVFIFFPRLFLGFIHGLVTGRTAILDLVVEAVPSSIERQKLLGTLRESIHDKRVMGVVLRLQGVPGGWASVQDMGAVIHEIRAAGKPVYAFIETSGNATTWLAAQCDRVFLVPTGEVNFLGLGADMVFFGAALQRLGVEPDFEAAGEFKSFGEPYLRAFPSRPNQIATQALLDSMHEQLVEGVSKGRELEVSAVQGIMERGPMGAEEAQAVGLVDELLYEDQFEKWVEEQHGDDARLVQFSRWAFFQRGRKWLANMGVVKKVVAVLHLEGPIVMEPGNSVQYIHGRKVASMVRRLREMDQISALVLNVNSPGGSAVASDLMWREIEQMGQTKPVVAVFDDVAASGGYYLSAPAAEIIARHGTLTGSIGVFGGKLVIGGLFRKVGVHAHSVQSGSQANYYSPHRRFTDQQRVRFRASLQRFYDGFVHRVASGRRRPLDEIEVHCRGRVWTGSDALERGLVDRLGNLDTGFERACALAGIREGECKRLDVTVEGRRMLLNKLRGRLHPLQGMSSILRPMTLRPVADFFAFMQRHEGRPLAMMPFYLRLK